jgi:hypothetical protein
MQVSYESYQRAIAESDKLWNDYQTIQQEHGMAAEVTCEARDAYLHSVQVENDAYDAYVTGQRTYRVGFAQVNSVGRMSKTYSATSEADARGQAARDTSVDHGAWAVWQVAEINA